MKDMPPSNPPGKLDYATPKPAPPIAGSVTAGLGGVLAVFSVCTLLGGFAGLAWVLYHDVYRHLGGVNTGADVFEMAMLVIIGTFCGAVSIRWLRYSNKIRARQGR
jgi:hypothetical protein